MKIAAALGVWPFWGWKIINHGGWFTQVKGRSWQKKAFLTVSFMQAWTGYSSWLQNYIAPSVHTSLSQHFYNTPSACTSLLQHFCITFTSFIHRFYIIPSAHTSLSSSVPFVHHPLPERADSGFSGCAGNASRPRNKLRPRSPFSDGKNAGNRTSPGWMVWISALCTCAHTHACRKNRACAFLAGFRVVCCLFYRFPVRNALRASQAVRATDVMFNLGNLLGHLGIWLKRWDDFDLVLEHVGIWKQLKLFVIRVGNGHMIVLACKLWMLDTRFTYQSKAGCSI